MEQITLSPKFIRDLRGRQTGVLLSNKDWNKMLEAVEDLNDIRDADEVMNDPNEVPIPWQQARAELEVHWAQQNAGTQVQASC